MAALEQRRFHPTGAADIDSIADRLSKPHAAQPREIKHVSIDLVDSGTPQHRSIDPQQTASPEQALIVKGHLADASRGTCTATSSSPSADAPTSVMRLGRQGTRTRVDQHCSSGHAGADQAGATSGRPIRRPVAGGFCVEFDLIADPSDGEFEYTSPMQLPDDVPEESDHGDAEFNAYVPSFTDAVRGRHAEGTPTPTAPIEAELARSEDCDDGLRRQLTGSQDNGHSSEQMTELSGCEHSQTRRLSGDLTDADRDERVGGDSTPATPKACFPSRLTLSAMPDRITNEQGHTDIGAQHSSSRSVRALHATSAATRSGSSTRPHGQDQADGGHVCRGDADDDGLCVICGTLTYGTSHRYRCVECEPCGCRGLLPEHGQRERELGVLPGDAPRLSGHATLTESTPPFATHVDCANACPGQAGSSARQGTLLSDGNDAGTDDGDCQWSQSSCSRSAARTTTSPAERRLEAGLAAGVPTRQLARMPSHSPERPSELRVADGELFTTASHLVNDEGRHAEQTSSREQRNAVLYVEDTYPVIGDQALQIQPQQLIGFASSGLPTSPCLSATATTSPSPSVAASSPQPSGQGGPGRARGAADVQST